MKSMRVRVAVLAIAVVAASSAALTTADSGRAYNIYTCDAIANTPYMGSGGLVANIQIQCGLAHTWIRLTGSLQKYSQVSGVWAWRTVQYFDSGQVAHSSGFGRYFTKSCPELGYYYRTQSQASWSTVPTSYSPVATSGTFFMYC
jgi:hypothetical protein